MEENKGEIRQGEEKRNIWSHWKTFLAVIVIIVVAYAGIAGKVNLGPNIATPDSPLRFLVNETVSASAPIVVRIPDGVAPIALNQVASIINFDPEIRGSWRAGTRVEELVFQPAEALTIGRHYSVNVSIANDVATSSTGVLHADFLVAENPAVLAVFPAKESEADESSAITIVFNRPMVPVSTLDEVDANKIPIEITPVTLGRFKWISTRNLQFIPKERLVRSSNYRVSIKNGFTSVEGLPVPAFESTFTTRPLRLNYTSSGQLRYNEPVRLNFNQPVDLARSKGEIVIRNAQGAIVPAIVEYGKGNDDKDDDQSTLLVWPASDSNGRVKFWDLLSNYNVSIGTVYPIEGDINLVAKKGAQINITDIIESFTPRSERTSISDTQLFDPVGTIEVSFFEDIDISRSKINAKGMRDIKYAEKCEEADENGYYIEDCTKVPDKKRIIISWKPEDFGRGEEVSVNFDSITNSDGVVINAIPIKRTLVTYPIFKIIKVIPSSGTGASLTDMTICSNSPIVPRGRDDWRDALVTSGYVAFNYWSEAYRSLDYYQSPCTVGEYRSDIRYGLIPETKYDITLKLTDTFGQTASKQISFTTGKASEFYTRIGSLQSQYEVTSPERTKLTYYTENLEYVNVNICQVSPETMLGFLADRPDITRSGSSLGCIYSKDVVVQLPKRYWVNNYFQFELSKYITNPLGQYVISLGHPSYVQTGWKSASESTRFNIYERTYLSVTRLAVGEKRVNWQDSYRGDGRDRSLLRDELGSGGQSLYWVTRFGSQVPVVGATVSTFVRVGDTGSIGRSGYGVTNVAGVAEIGAVLNYAGAIVRDGLDSAVISTWADTIGYASQAYSQSRTYIYTDRPIYRPTQSVHIKGIDRIAYDGVQKISSDKSATVIVYNSNNEKIAERVLGISAYGTFSLDVLLPRTAPLGTYRVESLGSYGYFDVEEYTPSAFELTAKNEKDEYIAGDTAHVGVDAKYYFGVPLDSGSVEYTIISQDYYFDKYSDEYFSFGRGWYYCYECGYGDRYVKRGTATIDKNGHANIVEKLDLDALFKDDSAKSSKIFVLAITVRDSTGREVTTTKSFIVHRGEFYLGVKTIPYYAGKNETFTIKGKSVDTLGKETNVRGAKLVVNKIVWKTFKRREVDGNFYYRSE
ncbi:MAG TPA: MG2 domain-containing protein [Candidatus Paceibacterota bacterium]